VGLFCFCAAAIGMLLFTIAKFLIEPLLFLPTQASHDH
jgi:H+/gluconate symporter-like permease